MKNKILTLFLLLYTSVLFSQDFYIEKKDKGIFRSLLDLNNNFALMCVVLHPGCEDFNSLAYYRYKYGVNTYIVYFTDGKWQLNYNGENIFENVAKIKRKESKASCKVLDAQPYYLEMPDLGYSKNLDEVTELWKKNDIEKKLTYLIRKIKPEIILINHSSNDVEAQRRAVVNLTLKSAEYAGDESKFTEQLENNATIWKPVRIFSIINNEKLYDTANFKLNTNEYDKNLGKYYYEIVEIAKNEYKSVLKQKFETKSTKVYYDIIADLNEEKHFYTNLFENLDIHFKKTGEDKNYIQLFVHRAIDNVSISYRIMKEMNELRSNIAEYDSLYNYKANQRIKNLAYAQVSLLSLKYSIDIEDHYIVPSKFNTLSFKIYNGSPVTLNDFQFKILSDGVWDMKGRASMSLDKLKSNGSLHNSIDVKLTESTISANGNFVNIKGDLYFEIESRNFYLPIEKQIKVKQPVGIELYPEHHIYLYDEKIEPFEAKVKITNNMKDRIKGTLKISVPPGWKCNEIERFFDLKGRKFTIFTFKLTPFPKTKERKYEFKYDIFILNPGLQRYQTNDGLLVIDFIKASFHKNLKIGIIKGYDNTIFRFLKNTGINTTYLNDFDINRISVKNFDTIIADFGAYSINEITKKYNQELLEFVKDGGNLLVLNQFPKDWNKGNNNPQYAPYEIELGYERVTNENSVVLILEPNNPVFKNPNSISQKAWEGWKIDRGFNFPKKWDDKYLTLISTYDKNEPPQNGGILMLRYGRGTYLYSSLFWNRELYLGNHGAVKIFINLISASKSIQ